VKIVRKEYSVSVKKMPSALKHGAYSTMTTLPGESVAEFEKLHRRLVAEWGGGGDLDDDAIATMARAMWRKKNLSTIRVAGLAQQWAARNEVALTTAVGENASQVNQGERDFIEKCGKAEQQARKELDQFYDLVEMGEDATFDQLFKELQAIERLDAIIDRCVKRLLFARGFRSLSIAPNPQQK
jgi:hypothetical protein